MAGFISRRRDCTILHDEVLLFYTLSFFAEQFQWEPMEREHACSESAPIPEVQTLNDCHATASIVRSVKALFILSFSVQRYIQATAECLMHPVTLPNMPKIRPLTTLSALST
jgi:hypothetical protein